MALLTSVQATDLVEKWLEDRGLDDPADWLRDRMVDMVVAYDKSAGSRAQHPNRSHVAGDIVEMSGASRYARIYLKPRHTVVDRSTDE